MEAKTRQIKRKFQLLLQKWRGAKGDVTSLRGGVVGARDQLLTAAVGVA